MPLNVSILRQKCIINYYFYNILSIFKETLNISFGNIAEDDFDEIYQEMRSYFDPPGQAWICQQKSEQILNLYEQHNLDRLPLPPDIAKEIYQNLNLGEETELYKKIKEIK